MYFGVFGVSAQCWLINVAFSVLTLDQFRTNLRAVVRPSVWQ